MCFKPPTLPPAEIALLTQITQINSSLWIEWLNIYQFLLSSAGNACWYQYLPFMRFVLENPWWSWIFITEQDRMTSKWRHWTQGKLTQIVNSGKLTQETEQENKMEFCKTETHFLFFNWVPSALPHPMVKRWILKCSPCSVFRSSLWPQKGQTQSWSIMRPIWSYYQVVDQQR